MEFLCRSSSTRVKGRLGSMSECKKRVVLKDPSVMSNGPGP